MRGWTFWKRFFLFGLKMWPFDDNFGRWFFFDLLETKWRLLAWFALFPFLAQSVLKLPCVNMSFYKTICFKSYCVFIFTQVGFLLYLQPELSFRPMPFWKSFLLKLTKVGFFATFPAWLSFRLIMNAVLNKFFTKACACSLLTLHCIT